VLLLVTSGKRGEAFNKFTNNYRPGEKEEPVQFGKKGRYINSSLLSLTLRAVHRGLSSASDWSARQQEKCRLEFNVIGWKIGCSMRQQQKKRRNVTNL